jgi:N-acetyl-anhydromuramyl-L-alanine amidase AmpD
VRAGEQIAIINPDSSSNGGTAPHLHLSHMAGVYNPNAKTDPLPRLAGALDPPGGAAPMTPRPDFNEYPVWSKNNQSRNGTKVDLFILHTQEGAGNADSLARWMDNNGVSYHYTISESPKDHGVTVCDVVDTDLASWSVLNANNRSINLCFAGSYAGWTRAQWLNNSRAIDVAAYLAVQDCRNRNYAIPLTVIAPPYTAGRAGITDHAYVTKVLGDGTHSDVGPNFPWDIFAQRVAYWANPTPVTPPPKPTPQYPRDFTDRQLLEDIWQKLMKLASK